jgi:hypothetical protein
VAYNVDLGGAGASNHFCHEVNMGRKRKSGASVAAYFKALFEQHPEWLALRANKPVLDQWMADNNATTVPANIKANLASLKSKLRAEGRGHKGKKPGTKGASRAATGAVSELEHLEVMIDRCVEAARELAVKNIGPVLRHLRIARAEIVTLFDE